MSLSRSPSTAAFVVILTLTGMSWGAPVATSTKTAEAATPVATWIERLKAPDASQRIQAVSALHELGPRAKEAGPALSTALGETAGSDHPAVRDAAKQIARAIQSVDPTVTVS